MIFSSLIFLCIGQGFLLLSTPGKSYTLKSNNAIIPWRTSAPNFGRLSPEIINDLKDFRNLIPEAIVDEIIAKHLIMDGGFRDAIKYLRSPAFDQLLDKVQQIPEVIEILNFLHLLDGTEREGERWMRSARNYQLDNVILNNLQNNQYETVAVVVPAASPATADDVNYSANIEIILLEVETKPKAPSSPDPTAANYTTFTSFVEELLEHLPHDRFVALINEKRKRTQRFDDFYAALRKADLKPMVETLLKSESLSSIIKTLQANRIDVSSLKTIAFEVISWGPAAVFNSNDLLQAFNSP